MTWIALKMLVGDRAKFFGIVLGLTFAALLITQQGSIFCGLMCRTAGQIWDITGADLWVMDANVQFVDDVKPMQENQLYRVRGVQGVRWAVPLYKGMGRAKVNSPAREPGGEMNKVIEQVILLGLDDASMVGAPPPERMFVGRVLDLRRPDAVIVDYTRLRKLYPGEEWEKLPANPSMFAIAGDWARRGLASAVARGTGAGERSVVERVKEEQGRFYERFVGRQFEMNDKRAVIVGVCEASRTFQSNAVVYTTYSRAKQFVPRERKLLSFVLARTDADPGASREVREARAAEVAAAIRRQTGLKARTGEEFIWDTIDYFMKYTGIPINFGITVALGFLVGTAIAGQTFYNFTLDNLKQFGALKAMGTTNSRIVGMILLQAVLVGLLGYGLGVGFASFFGLQGRLSNSELAYYTPWELLGITAGAVLLICVLASLLSVRKVIVLEPAIVFRG